MLKVLIKFSYLGDHVLLTKLRSERCANDLNHFQLKVPSGTFSIAEIGLPYFSNAKKFLFLTELLAGNGLNHWRNVPTSTWSEAHGHLSS